MVVASSACGCARVRTTYTPNKAEYREGVPPSTDEALVAYEGDVPTLVEAGGKVIGSMEGAGNGFASHGSVERKVRREAAEMGATHVVFVSAYDEEERTPVSYETKCSGNRCFTTGGRWRQSGSPAALLHHGSQGCCFRIRGRAIEV